MSLPKTSVLCTKPTPITAYEMCERACEAIEEEYRRYAQDTFVSRASIRGYSNAPACNTVACRAGWMYAAAKGFPALLGYLGKAYKLLDIVSALLKASEGSDEFSDDVVTLFSEKALLYEAGYDPDDECDEDDRPDLPEQGTRAYAQLGIQGLQNFMAKHETYLKSVKIS